MNLNHQTVLNMPRGHSDRVLWDLIAWRFATGKESDYTIQDAFRDLAEDYLSLSLDDGAMSRYPALEEESVQLLAEALLDAVAVGAIPPLKGPALLIARMALASLGSLTKQVRAGDLTAREAALTFTRLLFEGLNAQPNARSQQP